MQDVPDIVRLFRLEAQVSQDSSHTRHISYRSEAGKRRVRKEDEWQKIEIIGSGTFGQVHLERCIRGTQEGRLRAVKCFRKPKSRRFQQELHAIALFSHDHYERCFVKSYGWYEANDSIFISMEYVQNGDLQRFLQSPLQESDAQQIISQVLEGIDYMHEFNFAHRDLKPANILVVSSSPDWWVKIADFGVSKRIDENTTALRTHTGTLLFEAPEIFGFVNDSNDGQTYTLAVDIWSIGVIASMLLTGHQIFKHIRDIRRYSAGVMEFPLDDFQVQHVSRNGIEFTKALLQPQPRMRPSARNCCNHAWIKHLLEPEHLSCASAEVTDHEEGVATEEQSAYSKTWSDLDRKDQEPLPQTWETPGVPHNDRQLVIFNATQIEREDRGPALQTWETHGTALDYHQRETFDITRTDQFSVQRKTFLGDPPPKVVRFANAQVVPWRSRRVEVEDDLVIEVGDLSRQRPVPIQRLLPVSLEDLLEGTTKRVKMKHHTFDSLTRRYVHKHQILQIPIIKGSQPGNKIRYRDLPEQANGSPQDLYLILWEKPHPTLVRSGQDLQTTIEITLYEAQYGWEHKVQTIDGKTLVVSRLGYTPPSWQKRYPELGMPFPHAPWLRGHFTVRIRITDERAEDW